LLNSGESKENSEICNLHIVRPPAEKDVKIKFHETSKT